MRVEWSDDAPADLDRFAAFLQQQHGDRRLAGLECGNHAGENQDPDQEPTRLRTVGSQE
jgi:hypothetical protein